MSNGQKPVEALARGLKILEALSRSTGTMSNGQLSRETGLPQSTVSRLTHSLVQLGYLRFVPSSGAYQLTPKNLRLGYPVLMKLPLGARTYRVLDQLSETTGLTAALAERDDLHVTFMVVSRTRRHRTVPIATGARLPISVSAAGLAYIRALPESERQKAIRAITADLAGRGQSSAQFLERVSSPPSDYVISDGLWHEDVGGIATAVHIAGRLFSLTLVTARAEPEMENVAETLVPPLLQAAEELSD